jgi:bisphosphoglycerate-independent phosphoglycerate mutase (AlkP superfamily)
MRKEQVIELLKEAMAKLKEVQDAMVVVQLWAMDREQYWYAERGEQAGDYLYYAQKEIEELLGLKYEELE